MFSPYFFQSSSGLMQLLIILIALWTIPWKGIALWKSARLNQKIWFIVILIINLAGILAILYIFIFSKIKKKELENGKNNPI